MQYLLPGGCNSVACQFIRCCLHRLSANGIFIQIFQGHFGSWIDFLCALRCWIIGWGIPSRDLTLSEAFEELARVSLPDQDFFKVMASCLADFNELNQLQPLITLLEDLNGRKQLCREQTLHTLTNVATYLEALLPADINVNAHWSTFLPHLENLLRKVITETLVSPQQPASGKLIPSWVPKVNSTNDLLALPL